MTTRLATRMPLGRTLARGVRRPLGRVSRVAGVWAFAAAVLGLSMGRPEAGSPEALRVTSGDHPAFGRVVIEALGRPYTLGRDGVVLRVQFPGEPSFGALPPPPRNVLAIRAEPGVLELTLAADVTVHDSRSGSRVVIDVEDPRLDHPKGQPSTGEAARAVPASAGPPAVGAPPARPPPMPPPASAQTVLPAMALPAPEPSAATAHATPAKHLPASLVEQPVIAAAPAAVRPSDPMGGTSPRVPAASATGETRPKKPHDSVTDGEPPNTMASAAGESAGSGAGPPEEEPVLDSDRSAREPAQVWPVIHDAAPTGPVALVATRVNTPDGVTGTAIQIPFAESVGAALFARGSVTCVVFDERRPIDLAGLRNDPIFGSAVVTIYPSATLIRLSLTRGQSTVLGRAPGGWRISIIRESPDPAALTPSAANGTMTIAAEAPGQVVALTDPQTGGTLLVGTQRKPGQAILTERRTPEFLLPVTGQGVLVQPLSDRIALHISKAGFVLSGPPEGLVLSPPPPNETAVMAAARLTRAFEFPGQPTDVLAWRARQLAVQAAVAPPLARGPRRIALAESLLGLGMGVEAGNVLLVAAKDDPREAASPERIGLSAIAALLAGRLEDAGGLADPRLTGTDEVALWRAVQMAMLDENSQAAAAIFATTAPLLFTYPEEMRARVLPLALETMILGGQAKAAARLMAQQDLDPRLAYARALLKQAEGDNAGALKLLDQITNTRSPLYHFRAAVRATELRLAMGQLDAKAAAEALEKRLYAWRGDGRDLRLRERIAELQEQAGGWRAAFAVLRSAKADFPNQAADIDRRLKEAFAALPNDPSVASIPPMELIALLEENTNLMASGPDGEPMRARLAEKLMALDLPKRADPVLQTLMRAAPLGPARAGFGATLATLRLREGDGDGALLAISESNSADMPEPVRERRALIAARVEAKRGDLRSAVEALAGIDTTQADETRAAILEAAQEWPAARDALAMLASRAVPASGMLDEAQGQIVLRLATAATRAGDDGTLAALRQKYQTRFGAGAASDMFRLLTEAPVRGTADLSRARAEIGVARAVAAAEGARPAPRKTP